jgi:serine/threonine protein kinase
MNPADVPAGDETIDQALAAYHEALVRGNTPPPEEGQSTPLELSPALAGLQACLRRLEEDRLRTVAEGDRVAVSPDLAFDPQPGTGRLGRFELLEELGRGGGGIVFRAFDPLLRREVALKVPRPEVILTPELRQRFRREAQAAAGLDHPNVVPIFEVGEVGAVCFLVSPYCRGLSLAAWLRQQTTPVCPRQAAEWLAALADGVAHMHARGVLHRDLKPANILLQKTEVRSQRSEVSEQRSAEGGGRSASSDLCSLTSDFWPKITDFGLAKVRASESLQTQNGAIVGTPVYMAPEQALGRLDDIGPHTDIHALGVILYELLTGRPPFQGANDLDTLQNIVNTQPRPPRSVRLDLPRELEQVCLNCLAKEPTRRYASAALLADDLRRILDGRPIQTRPELRWQRAVSSLWLRRRYIAAVGALVLLGLLFAGVVWVSQRQHDERIAAEGTRQAGPTQGAERDPQEEFRERRDRQYLELSAAARACSLRKAPPAVNFPDGDFWVYRLPGFGGTVGFGGFIGGSEWKDKDGNIVKPPTPVPPCRVFLHVFYPPDFQPTTGFGPAVFRLTHSSGSRRDPCVVTLEVGDDKVFSAQKTDRRVCVVNRADGPYVSLINNNFTEPGVLVTVYWKVLPDE